MNSHVTTTLTRTLTVLVGVLAVVSVCAELAPCVAVSLAPSTSIEQVEFALRILLRYSLTIQKPVHQRHRNNNKQKKHSDAFVRMHLCCIYTYILYLYIQLLTPQVSTGAKSNVRNPPSHQRASSPQSYYCLFLIFNGFNSGLSFGSFAGPLIKHNKKTRRVLVYTS